jgi:hypothetical protein
MSDLWLAVRRHGERHRDPASAAQPGDRPVEAERQPLASTMRAAATAACP